MKLNYAIFDLDGTLLDSLPVWDNLGLNMLRAQGYDPDPALGKQLKIMTMKDGAQLCKDLFHMPQSIEEIAALVEDQAKLAYNTVIGPKPGAENFLKRLKEAGIPMYIATNTRRDLVEDGLRRNGLLSYFKGIITCPEVGQALRLLGGTKEDTVVFEDALHPIRTAKKAGFQIAAVYDASSEGEHEEIKALSDYYFYHYDEITVEI